MKDILSKEHARILAEVAKEQAPGPHASIGSSYEKERARIARDEAAVDAERERIKRRETHKS